MDKAFAHSFAAEWIAAWNSHDLERILSHYAEAVEFSSPMVAKLLNQPTGKLNGKAIVHAYWAKGLSRRPDLKFKFRAVLTGVQSLVIHYEGLDGINAAEYFEFGSDGKVARSAAHYGDGVDNGVP